MDKRMAKNTVANAGMNLNDVADSIYQATVMGISGANQNEGYGFALSAVAELWNIRGTIGNPNARTKITNRYKGMNVAKMQIYNALQQYPDGIPGYSPTFDDLLGVSQGGMSSGGNTYAQQSFVGGQMDSDDDMQRNFDKQDSVLGVALIAGFIVCKFVLHWGWIASIIAAFVIAGIAMAVLSRR